jgi:hypothetical protein
MPVLTHHPELGRAIRADDWAGLATGTWPRLAEAIGRGDAAGAADLAGFFVVEARVIQDIYGQWLQDTRRCLRDKGLAEAEIAAEDARVAALACAGRPAIVADRDAAWAEVERLAAEVAAGTGPMAAAERLRDLWRHLHDAQVDHLSGLFDVVIRRFGEPALGEMYEGWVIGDWFAKRYQRFDTSRFDWAEAFPLIVYLTFESMHGHMSGPGRQGDVAFEEFDDRVVFTFAPCGSGGRTVVGEPLDGTPPRMENPYRFKVLEGAHPFAWNTPGVCTYCAHCCVLTEKLPIEHFGYPVRVVDPPLYPNGGPGDDSAVCRWTVYRRPDLVPASVYTRLGLRKPGAGEPLGSAGKASRDAAAGSAP